MAYRGNRTTWNGFGHNGSHGPVKHVLHEGHDVQIKTILKRDAALLVALNTELNVMAAPIETRQLAERMARSVNASEILATVSEISGWLNRVAPVCPEAARDVARAFANQHGTVSLPWRWTSRNYQPLPAIDLRTDSPAGDDMQLKPPMDGLDENGDLTDAEWAAIQARHAARQPKDDW